MEGFRLIFPETQICDDFSSVGETLAAFPNGVESIESILLGGSLLSGTECSQEEIDPISLYYYGMVEATYCKEFQHLPQSGLSQTFDVLYPLMLTPREKFKEFSWGLEPFSLQGYHYENVQLGANIFTYVREDKNERLYYSLAQSFPEAQSYAFHYVVGPIYIEGHLFWSFLNYEDSQEIVSECIYPLKWIEENLSGKKHSQEDLITLFGQISCFYFQMTQTNKNHEIEDKIVSILSALTEKCNKDASIIRKLRNLEKSLEEQKERLDLTEGGVEYLTSIESKISEMENIQRSLKEEIVEIQRQLSQSSLLLAKLALISKT